MSDSKGRTKRLQQPLTNDAFINQAMKRGREMSNTLGDICRYDLSGVEIPPVELFDILTKLGLEKWAPVPIRRKTAARKAITRIKRTFEDPANDLKVIVRRVHTKEPDMIRYAIVNETLDASGTDLDYTTRNQVIFRTDTGTMEFTQDVNEEILRMFDYLCSVYTDVEILHMVKSIVTNHGSVWLRDGSGMFFMPTALKDVVDSLIKLFDTLAQRTDHTCYFRPISILNDADNRATMGEALIADITVELNEASAKLDEAIDNESSYTLTAALKGFKIAKGKAAMYQDMLQLNVDSIHNRIKDADAKASLLLQQITINRAVKKDSKNV